MRVAALCLGITFLTFVFAPFLIPIVQDKAVGSELELWYRWDTEHYLGIARDGYPPPTLEGGADNGFRAKVIAFFPLYPWLIRLLGTVVGNPLLAALLVSNLACLAASLLFYQLARLDRDASTSLRAVTLLLIFPTAYFLHAGYSESLFLALSLGSFYFARRGRWALASGLGFFLTLTRLTGLAILPALCVEYYLQRRAGNPSAGFRDALWPLRRPLLWLLLIPLGFVVYLGLNHHVHENAFAFLEYQRAHWQKAPAPPWAGFLNAWQQSRHATPHNAMLMGAAEWAAGLFALVFGIWAALRVRLSYGVYCLASWLMITMNVFWLSTPRYILPLFPIFIVAADLCKGPVRLALWSFASVALYGLMMSRFIQGYWAF